MFDIRPRSASRDLES